MSGHAGFARHRLPSPYAYLRMSLRNGLPFNTRYHLARANEQDAGATV
jgi:hypothetical protein